MKTRILLVDDDAQIRQIYGHVFAGDDTWDAAIASGGREALAKIQVSPFDILLTDMRMPDMSGAELVQEAVRLHPQMSRIVVSGFADQEQIAQCLSSTHQFISKPFSVAQIKTTVCRIASLDRLLLSEKLKAVVGRIHNVPSMPTLYFSIMRALVSPNNTIEQIGQIVAQDPAMTAKVLQLVNSSFFNIARNIVSPGEAIQYLGVGRLRSLALSLHIFSCFDRQSIPRLSVERVWDHSLTTAVLAEKIVRAAHGDRDAQDAAYVAGMLHDIGKVLLAANLPQEYGRAIEIASETRIPMIAAERKVFGVSHAEVGAYLLGLWGLPVEIVEAVALHHDPLPTVTDHLSPLAAVHVASALENEAKNNDVGVPQPPINVAFLHQSGYEGQLPGWRVLLGETLAAHAA